MAEELSWSRSRKWQEMKGAVHWLESMGLDREAVRERCGETFGGLPEPIPRGVWENLESWAWRGTVGALMGGLSRLGAAFNSGTSAGSAKGGGWARARLYSRSQFEPGEVAVLRSVFAEKAILNVKDGEAKVKMSDVLGMLRGVMGYEDVRERDFEYVIGEAGLKGREEVGFYEFVEVGLPPLILSCLP
jgi:glycerol-3-phosphate dehydrogenase